MRFSEFKNKLVYVSYGEPAKSIIGKLIHENKSIIKIKTYSQTIIIGANTINILQVHREPSSKKYEGTIGDEVE